jgi:hypothetical protein
MGTEKATSRTSAGAAFFKLPPQCQRASHDLAYALVRFVGRQRGATIGNKLVQINIATSLPLPL